MFAVVAHMFGMQSHPQHAAHKFDFNFARAPLPPRLVLVQFRAMPDGAFGVYRLRIEQPVV